MIRQVIAPRTSDQYRAELNALIFEEAHQKQEWSRVRAAKERERAISK